MLQILFNFIFNNTKHLIIFVCVFKYKKRIEIKY